MRANMFQFFIFAADVIYLNERPLQITKPESYSFKFHEITTDATMLKIDGNRIVFGWLERQDVSSQVVRIYQQLNAQREQMKVMQLKNNSFQADT